MLSCKPGACRRPHVPGDRPGAAGKGSHARRARPAGQDPALGGRARAGGAGRARRPRPRPCAWCWLRGCSAAPAPAEAPAQEGQEGPQAAGQGAEQLVQAVPRAGCRQLGEPRVGVTLGRRRGWVRADAQGQGSAARPGWSFDWLAGGRAPALRVGVAMSVRSC